MTPIAVTFDTRVTSAVHDEARELWTVTTDTGETVDTQFLIIANGCLLVIPQPRQPDATSADTTRRPPKTHP